MKSLLQSDVVIVVHTLGCN